MASTARAVAAATTDPWLAIHRRDVPLVVEAGMPPCGTWVADLLARAPFCWRASGAPGEVADLLEHAPSDLRALVAGLAQRFATLMDTDHVSVRVEGVTGNACTRMHADYTDVRLILTLAGPGTEHLAGDNPAAPVRQLPPGHIGLFKGRSYPGAGHAPCLHRSPAIEGSGQCRLLLVIDTVREADCA